MNWKVSQISKKYPSYRNSVIIAADSWLEGKRQDDNAEGLWRIYDSIYDLTDFIDRHPGGSDWIRLTRGTDITELFETHHLTEGPKSTAAKFKVRDVLEPRNITLTLNENGFYRTLKSRVVEKLKTMDKKKFSRKSDLIHTTMLILSFVTAMSSAHFQSKLLAILAGLFITWTVVIAHNYFHRKDNWRMYTFNLSLMNYKDWRVMHAMSHHMFPNSFHDLEISLFEPLLCWTPYVKNSIQRYVSWIYSPLVYSMCTVMQSVRRIIYALASRKNILDPSDLIPFIVPLAMYTTRDASPLKVLELWLIIVLSSGFTFGTIGLNAAHHHPDIIHEGDTLRENRDWGLYQIDTIIERADLKGSQFLALTHFGDHILHHLFPTLDHGLLPHLYPVLHQTLEEFESEVRQCCWLYHIVGQFKQLARIHPTTSPPKKKNS